MMKQKTVQNSEQTQPEPWQVAADAALSVEHEIRKTGLKLSRQSTVKISKAIRDAIYADNSGSR